MFELRCRASTFYYDSALGRFYDASHELLNPLLFEHISPLTNNHVVTKDMPEEYLHNHTQIQDSRGYQATRRPNVAKLKLLDIMLGMKCNYRCQYCLQNDARADIQFDEERFVEIITRSGINLNQIRQIRVWGGEPFVYWDRFVKLVEILRHRFGYKGQLWTVSNGSLFSQDKCTFCLENAVAVMFSHDGRAQTVLRNKRDFLDDLNIRAAVIRQLQAGRNYMKFRENFSVTGGILMVLGPYNLDIEDSLDYLEKRLFENFPSKIATVFKADSRSKSILDAYGETGLETLKNNLLKGLKLREGDRFYSYFYNLRRLRDTVARHLIYGLPYASFKARCPAYMSAERLSFDTEGRILVCYADSPDSLHNHGNIEDLSSCYWDLKSLHDRPLCRDCPYVAACMGGCPMLNAVDHEIRCQSMMPYNQALFEAAFEQVFKDQILEIRKVK